MRRNRNTAPVLSPIASGMKLGILGICPVCEAEYKVRGGKLVHHGFTRPGDGQIHGDCFAVNYEPYERSTKGCVDYKAVAALNLYVAKDTLKTLPTKAFFSEFKTDWRTNKMEVVEYAIGVTERYDWEKLVTAQINSTKRTITILEGEIARMDRLIAGWTLKPLREVTEEAAIALTKSVREARKAERDAKNAVKNAKASALKAKRDARKAFREETFVAFVTTLKSLADSDKTKEEKKRFADAAWAGFFSPKTKKALGGNLSDFLYEFRKRNLDFLLYELGVAERETYGAKYPGWTYFG